MATRHRWRSGKGREGGRRWDTRVAAGMSHQVHASLAGDSASAWRSCLPATRPQQVNKVRGRGRTLGSDAAPPFPTHTLPPAAARRRYFKPSPAIPAAAARRSHPPRLLPAAAPAAAAARPRPPASAAGAGCRCRRHRHHPPALPSPTPSSPPAVSADRLTDNVLVSGICGAAWPNGTGGGKGVGGYPLSSVPRTMGRLAARKWPRLGASQTATGPGHGRRRHRPPATVVGCQGEKARHRTAVGTPAVRAEASRP